MAKLKHKGVKLQRALGHNDYDVMHDVMGEYTANMPKMIKNVPKKDKPAVKRFFKSVKMTKKKYF